MEAIKRVTIPFRHALVKLLAPKMFKTYAPPVKYRPMTMFINEVMGKKKLVGVEIGVFTGTNALSMLKKLNMKRLYLIDPYVPYELGVEITGNTRFEAEKKLVAYKNKVRWIFLRSEEAVAQVPRNLDFVYIDGDHRYDCVKKDIALYYEKLRCGGILGGHDFSLNGFRDVVYAAVEFARTNNLKLYGKDADFWVIKP